jgi:hypothetical protein
MFELFQSSRARPFGFRLSIFDGVFLIAAAIATLWLHNQDSPMWWVLAVVVVHFFLFCNVVRLHRHLELIWAVVFLVNVGWFLMQGHLNWVGPLSYQSPLTLALIMIEVRSERYHGVAAQRFNPRLDDYLRGRESRRQR